MISIAYSVYSLTDVLRTGTVWTVVVVLVPPRSTTLIVDRAMEQSCSWYCNEDP
jgi:hypothetical protein